MSMPHEQLREIAVANKPTLSIKPNATWVAILLHTKGDFDEIKDEADFMWLKCHDRITIKTLKHEYFSRHPLEEFRLMHQNTFPKASAQVSLLRKREASGDNLVVLRALEPEDAEHESQVIQDRDFVEQMKKAAASGKPLQTDAGKSEADAIVIGDDEEDATLEPNGVAGHDIATMRSVEFQEPSGDLHQEKSHNGDNDNGDDNVEITDVTLVHDEADGGEHAAKEFAEPGKQSQPASVALVSFKNEEVPKHSLKRRWSEMDRPDQQLQLDMAIARGDSPRSFLNAMGGIGEETPHQSEEYKNTNFDEQMADTANTISIPAEILLRIASLPEPEKARITASMWHTCASPSCKIKMYLKPWTRVGPNGGVLCTTCSRKLVQQDSAELAVLHELVTQEIMKKHDLEVQGRPQNSDGDAPYDWPYELAYASSSNEDTDDRNYGMHDAMNTYTNVVDGTQSRAKPSTYFTTYGPVHPDDIFSTDTAATFPRLPFSALTPATSYGPIHLNDSTPSLSRLAIIAPASTTHSRGPFEANTSAGSMVPYDSGNDPDFDTSELVEPDSLLAQLKKPAASIVSAVGRFFTRSGSGDEGMRRAGSVEQSARNDAAEGGEVNEEDTEENWEEQVVEGEEEEVDMSNPATKPASSRHTKTRMAGSDDSDGDYVQSEADAEEASEDEDEDY